jgi:hypothetical protein
MRRVIFTFSILFPLFLFGQTQSLWSRDSVKYSSKQEIHSSQFTSPLFAEPNEFFISDSIKNQINMLLFIHGW